MDDSALVRRGESARDLRGVIGRAPRRNRALPDRRAKLNSSTSVERVHCHARVNEALRQLARLDGERFVEEMSNVTMTRTMPSATSVLRARERSAYAVAGDSLTSGTSPRTHTPRR